MDLGKDRGSAIVSRALSPGGTTASAHPLGRRVYKRSTELRPVVVADLVPSRVGNSSH